MDAPKTTQSQDSYLELAGGGGLLLRNPIAPWHPRPQPQPLRPRRVNLLPAEARKLHV